MVPDSSKMNSLLRPLLCVFLLLGSFTGLRGSSDAPEGGSITIRGVVRHPGKYEVSGPTPIMNALELAGGIPDAPYTGVSGPPTPSRSNVRVVRGSSVFKVNLGRSRTREDEAFTILPGDLIEIPEVIF